MRKMTELEKEIRQWFIFDVLAPEHKTFAKHLANYDVHLTDDPSVAARVFPKYGVIEINDQIDNVDVLSALVRHELMHLILQHEKNGIKWLAPKYNIDVNHMTRPQYEFLKQKLYEPAFVPGLSADDSGNIKYGKGSISNFAGDWHLSNYYTEKDIDVLVRDLGVMVIELDHPEMAGMSYFELLDEVSKWEREYRRAAMDIVEGNLIDDETFEIDGEECAIYDEDSKT